MAETSPAWFEKVRDVKNEKAFGPQNSIYRTKAQNMCSDRHGLPLITKE